MFIVTDLVSLRGHRLTGRNFQIMMHFCCVDLFLSLQTVQILIFTDCQSTYLHISRMKRDPGLTKRIPIPNFKSGSFTSSTVKPVLSSHSKRTPKLVLNNDYRLMQVKSIEECSNGNWSILQYF